MKILEMKLKILKHQLEIEKFKHQKKMDEEKLKLLQDNTNDIQEDDGFIEAMQAEVKNIWKDEIIEVNETN